MMEVPLEERVIAHVQALSPDKQQQVLEFIEAQQFPKHTPTPPGTPGRDLMHLVGLFSKEEAEEMMRVIEEDCERIDPDGW